MLSSDLRSKRKTTHNTRTQSLSARTRGVRADRWCACSFVRSRAALARAHVPSLVTHERAETDCRERRVAVRGSSSRRVGRGRTLCAAGLNLKPHDRPRRACADAAVACELNAQYVRAIAIVVKPTLRQAWSREDPGPQCAFKMSMFNESCNSH